MNNKRRCMKNFDKIATLILCMLVVSLALAGCNNSDINFAHCVLEVVMNKISPA